MDEKNNYLFLNIIKNLFLYFCFHKSYIYEIRKIKIKLMIKYKFDKSEKINIIYIILYSYYCPILIAKFIFYSYFTINHNNNE